MMANWDDSMDSVKAPAVLLMPKLTIERLVGRGLGQQVLHNAGLGTGHRGQGDESAQAQKLLECRRMQGQ